MSVDKTKMLLLRLLIMAQLALVQQSVTSTATSQPESGSIQSHNSNFKEPLVWNENSLYKNSDKQKSKGLSSRWRRSPSSSPAPSAATNQLVDACQSKMEILTPYYATNSKGKLRTIVNSELMQQAIQVETCLRSPPGQMAAKCNAQADCGCEQKYKWHRLLVLDPRDSGSSRGLFMDWFLFPSFCVCRCKSTPANSSTKQLLRFIKKTSE